MAPNIPYYALQTGFALRAGSWHALFPNATLDAPKDANLMSRLSPITDQNISPEQRKTRDAITGGKRGKDGRIGLANEDGSLIGPFNAMLHSPEIGDRLQKLGEALRYDNSLPARTVEIAILCVARQWQAEFEWWAHKNIAKRAGLEDAIIDAIYNEEKPDFSDAGEAAAHRAARELLTNHQYSNSAYRELVEAYGERGAVDLTVLVGYYGAISGVLNGFDIPLPPEVAPVFE
jgi:4-carboxymuconolactone decarboxylase